MNNQKVLGFWGGPLAGGLVDYADDHVIRYATTNLNMRIAPSLKEGDVIRTIPRGGKVALATFPDDKTFTEDDLDLLTDQIAYDDENLPHTNEGIKWGIVSYPADEDKYGWVSQKYLSPTKPKPKPKPTPTTTSDTPTVVKDDKKTQQAGIGTGGTFAMVALVGIAAYFLFSKKK